MNNQNDLFDNQVPLPNAQAVLVLGIISIVGCFLWGLPGLICGVIALVLAKKDLQLYEQNPSKYTVASLSNLRTGKTCAIVGLILSIVAVLLGVIYFVFMLTMFQDLIKEMPRH